MYVYKKNYMQLIFHAIFVFILDYTTIIIMYFFIIKPNIYLNIMLIL